MHYIPGNAQHIGARQSQQDSFGFGELEDLAYVAHAGFLALVCDGMGGLQHGDLASKAAVRTMRMAYRVKTEAESIPEALERSARMANQAVFDLSRQMGTAEGLGTTLVACVLHDANLYWISIGDSNAYLCRHGDMMLLTRAHVFSNMLEEAVARGAMSQEQAEQHPERDSLTSFVGIEHLAEIDRNLQAFPLTAGDTVLIASDGLYKALSDDEIRSAMPGPPESWAESLVARTLAAQHPQQDNVTVVTVTLAAPPATVPEAIAAHETVPEANAALSDAAPRKRVRWWPTALLAAIALIVSVLFWVLREPAKSVPQRDSATPAPPRTLPRLDVEPPKLDPARVIRPEPPGPKTVEVPKPDSGKPSGEAKR